MGHWQYILDVNTILFVRRCIISSCSFIIPVRIQSSSFWRLLIWQRTLFEQYILFFSWKKMKKKKQFFSFFLSTVMGSSYRGYLRRCLSVGGPQTLHNRISPRQQVSQLTCGQWRRGRFRRYEDLLLSASDGL